MSCFKCNHIQKLHRHHITYNPEKIVTLCISCHSFITAINTRYAKWKGKIKLTNEEREKLFDFFLITDKNIIEAVLNKKAKLLQPLKKKKIKKEKYNPLWRPD